MSHVSVSDVHACCGGAKWYRCWFLFASLPCESMAPCIFLAFSPVLGTVRPVSTPLLGIKESSWIFQPVQLFIIVETNFPAPYMQNQKPSSSIFLRCWCCNSWYQVMLSKTVGGKKRDYVQHYSLIFKTEIFCFFLLFKFFN